MIMPYSSLQMQANSSQKVVGRLFHLIQQRRYYTFISRTSQQQVDEFQVCIELAMLLANVLFDRLKYQKWLFRKILEVEVGDQL